MTVCSSPPMHIATQALAGRLRGGPAKIAIIGSSLFGTISGSPIANVMAIGTFTIPLMKKCGYRRGAATAASDLPPVVESRIIPKSNSDLMLLMGDQFPANQS